MAGIAVIVQARMTSTRLPGKVLLDIGGRTVLSHTLERCKAIPGIGAVCCAIPEGAAHDAVVAEAKRCGVEVFRGSENDVLDRYWRAARWLGAKTVVRVTSDCPLIDPGVCGQVLRLVSHGGAAYACNNLPPTWPHGLDCEAFTFAALDEAARNASAAAQREHVTPWMRENPRLARVNLLGPGGWAAEQRWALDFPEDLAFFRELFAQLPSSVPIPSMDDVLAVLRERADIAALNACRHGVSRPGMPTTTEGGT